MQKPRATSAGPVDAGLQADNSLAGDVQLLAQAGSAPQFHSMSSCPASRALTDATEYLSELARNLARPVLHGWLNLGVADAILVNAVCHSVPAGADILGIWRDMQTILRREVADALS
jgi:hypothetical protein